jgi:hypothetical protein
MNREQLLAVMQETARPKPTPVEVPKWGTVYVRVRTLEEVDADGEKESKAQEADKKDNRTRRLARAVCKVLCDEQGNRLFDSDEHVDLIAAQPYHVMQAVLSAAGGKEHEDEGKSEGASS